MRTLFRREVLSEQASIQLARGKKGRVSEKILLAGQQSAVCLSRGHSGVVEILAKSEKRKAAHAVRAPIEAPGSAVFKVQGLSTSRHL